MQSLLHKSVRTGYPVDFLLSRIRGRQVSPTLRKNMASAKSGTYLVDDTVIWSAAADERYWLYQQMDIDLRKALAPVFVYFELNTFVLCLRNLEAHQADNLTVDLEKSLLAEDLKKIILAKSPLLEIITKLERYLESSSLKVKGLSAAYEEKGFQGCEELIRNTFLEQVIHCCVHQEVIIFFRSLIDLKNTVTMAKCLRWDKEEISAVMTGGNIKLLNAEKVPSKSTLGKMIRRFAGGLKLPAEDLHPVRLEPLLRSQFSRNMTRRMRGGDPVCMCVCYIWNCFEAARERSREYQDALFAEKFPDVSESIQ